MRYATIVPRHDGVPIAAVALPAGGWVGLDRLAQLSGRLEELLPALLNPKIELASRAAAWTGPRHADDEICFLPPVVRPPSFRDFYAFEQHVKTARGKRGLEVPPAWYEIPVFYFSNPNALVGHDAAVFAPAGCAELDYELELGIIIGRGGRDIPVERAWQHVGGLTVLNDFSARDLQRHEVSVGLGPAKAKDFATAVGPWLVMLDEFAGRIDGEKLSLEMSARVNGRQLSRGNVATLHHTIPRLIARASRDAMLLPGDLLGTGTVGTGCILELGAENTGGWLKPGDVVELQIEGVGVLRTPIVSRPAG